MVQVNINLRTAVKGFLLWEENMCIGSNVQPIGSEKELLFNRMLPMASCLTRSCRFSVCTSSFSILHQNTHTHTHATPPHTQPPTSVLRQEHITWWPLQVTDGNLTALLTVNWVLIKPKHMWEMLIIHCRLEESNLENTVTMHVHRWFIITFPCCDKITIIGIADEKCEAGWTVWCIPGCKDPGAPSLSKINMDKDSANSDPAVLKQTLAKLSMASSSCLFAMKK